MESKYNYFKRDISWLSFNYRVLLEATDEHLPLYERINFISIYSSNLESFTKSGWPTIKQWLPEQRKAMKKPYNLPVNW